MCLHFCRFCRNSRVFVSRGAEKGPIWKASGHMGMWSVDFLTLPTTLHTFFLYTVCLNRFCMCVCDRCDPVHLVGWLPTLLGRRPTQTVPTN